MKAIIFTLDYELFGDGTGSVRREQINPTNQLLDIFDLYGAKLTIFFEYGQFLGYEKFSSENNSFKRENDMIEAQLIDAIQRGHDVQFHYHSTWHNVTFQDNKFILNETMFDISNLSDHEIEYIFRSGKQYLEDLLKQSDFISLHIPHNQESHYLLNEKTLSLMKDGSYLVNVARGGVVDENALYNALKDGKLAGAAVDVFEQEPPSNDNKLLTLDNIILSPHLGASTKEAQIQAGTICADQMNKVLSGEDPDFWVNKKFM